VIDGQEARGGASKDASVDDTGGDRRSSSDRLLFAIARISLDPLFRAAQRAL
jgi:hypothetical protein